MNEANGMRVERQKVRLMLQDIKKECDELWECTSYFLWNQNTRKMELDRKFKELLDILQKDPGRR